MHGAFSEDAAGKSRSPHGGRESVGLARLAHEHPDTKARDEKPRYEDEKNRPNGILIFCREERFQRRDEQSQRHDRYDNAKRSKKPGKATQKTTHLPMAPRNKELAKSNLDLLPDGQLCPLWQGCMNNFSAMTADYRNGCNAR